MENQPISFSVYLKPERGGRGSIFMEIDIYDLGRRVVVVVIVVVCP